MSQNNETAAVLETAWRAYCAAPPLRDCGRPKVDAAVLAALEAQQTDGIESALASAEPVAYEERMRPVWDERAPWTPWERCSRESYENCVSKPKPWISNDWEIQRRSLYTHAQPAAKVEAARFETSPEDRFEQFVQAEIARSPKPLQELGEYLTRVLDEDEFPTANRLLLQLAVEYSTPASVPDGLCAVQRYMVKLETNAHGHNYVKAVEDPDGDFVFHEDAAAHEAHGLTSKQAWWAGARAGLGVPADMPRKRVADLLGQRVVIDVYQQDWMPGFAAFLDDGSLAENGRPKFAINLGAFIASVSTGDIEKSEIPYFVAETLMHVVIHVIEKWAGVEFSEEWVDALIEKYTLASRSPDNQEGATP